MLTFDEGPATHHAKGACGARARTVLAAFFVVGKSSAAFPELVRAFSPQGHTIAYHARSHPMSSNVSFEQMKRISRRHRSRRDGTEWGLDYDSFNPVLPFFAILSRQPRCPICCNRAGSSSSGQTVGQRRGKRCPQTRS
ncbi:polysaccharide deacetylase family protein [Bradyrhizobium sp. 193]|uniref:polysaccharide deacetylase family protein n=1 Tax=Bradyrhizobium sp. 193 TaxID=2782661 RepID=UPI001FFBACD4